MEHRRALSGVCHSRIALTCKQMHFSRHEQYLPMDSTSWQGLVDAPHAFGLPCSWAYGAKEALKTDMVGSVDSRFKLP